MTEEPHLHYKKKTQNKPKSLADIRLQKSQFNIIFSQKLN